MSSTERISTSSLSRCSKRNGTFRIGRVSPFYFICSCSIVVLLVLFLRRPETNAFNALYFTAGPTEALTNTVDGMELPLMVNRSQVVYALQEVERLRCLRDLQQRLRDDFRPFIEGRQNVVLMDVALHSNLGDNILWKAAIELITGFGVSPTQICYVTQKAFLPHIDEKFAHCEMPQVVKGVENNGVVLLHAGGNWGDLYRFVHQGRMDYLKTLATSAAAKNFTIVQLPQSVDYAQQSQHLKRDDAIMAQIEPGRFVFSARQEDSFKFAQEHYPHLQSILTVDIAYILGPLMPSGPPSVDVLIQMRQDIEVQKSDENHYKWIKEQFSNANMTFDYRDWWYHPKEHKGELSKQAPHLLGDVRLKAGVDLISKGKILITNRLHGSLLGTLLGRHVFIIDTVGGKLKRVHDSPSLQEAVLSAIKLHASMTGGEFHY